MYDYKYVDSIHTGVWLCENKKNAYCGSLITVKCRYGKFMGVVNAAIDDCEQLLI